MTETSMQTDRTQCPNCGKDVAVNKDGSLRKHDCGELEPEPTAVAEPAEEVAAEVPPRRYCALPNCGRRPSVGDYCSHHWTLAEQVS